MADKKPEKAVEVVEEAQDDKRFQNLIVVAIGASAGGLEAITSLLRASKPNGYIAFVIAQHMAPQHRSVLVELLSKDCEYRVVGATEGALIKPDTVYVNTPNTDIVVKDGHIHLKVPTTDVGEKPSIDKLFNSVAEAFGNQAIGIVLSGTGSDGTQGCRAIRDAGGITIVQNPETAKYDGMPNSVIRARTADLILSPEEIAAYLPELHKHPAGLPSSKEDEASTGEVVSMDGIIDRVFTVTGVDFRQYKKATLERQLQRRISALRLNSIEEYFSHIDGDPEELEILQRSFLISVTGFFRDAEAFASLGTVIDNVIEQAAETRIIRIWVPACATGEEVYSIAIMLAERLGPTLRGYEVKIFATDIDDISLEVARHAAYVDAVIEHLDERVLYNYFDREGTKYRVKKWIRDMCMFARHDLIKDPPFLKMNLISCRNLMIYLSSQLQNQLVNNFHYALTPGGFLFMGKSESIGTTGDKLFEVVSKTNKIFRRKSGVVSYGRFGASFATKMSHGDSAASKTIAPVSRLAERVRGVLVDTFAPPTIQLNDAFQPMEYFGDVSAYLQIQPGKANFDIVSLASPQLQTEVRALVNRCSRSDAEKVEHMVRFRFPNEETAASVNIIVRKLLDTVTDSHIYLMTFKRLESTSSNATLRAESITPEDIRALTELEEELDRTRDHLQAVIEELETSNEELQALNEELQASTEELQASNEELETTNEELQATNEELTTVNDELQAKSILLTDTNETLNNIQRSLDMGLIVVDVDHRVTRFTPQTVRLFGILPDDIGHKLTKLPKHIEIDDLGALIDSVISTGTPVRRQIERPGEKYLMNISPYRRDQGVISGAVLTFTETTKLSESQDRADYIQHLLQTVGSVMDDGVLVTSRGMTDVLFVSSRLEDFLQRKSEVLTRDPETFLDVVHNEDRERVVAQYRDHDATGWDITYRLKRRDGSIVKVRDRAVLMENKETSGADEMVSLLQLVEEQ